MRFGGPQGGCLAARLATDKYKALLAAYQVVGCTAVVLFVDALLVRLS